MSQSAQNLGYYFKNVNVTTPMHRLAIYMHHISVLCLSRRTISLLLLHQERSAVNPSQTDTGDLQGHDLFLLVYQEPKGTQQRHLSPLLLQF